SKRTRCHRPRCSRRFDHPHCTVEGQTRAESAIPIVENEKTKGQCVQTDKYCDKKGNSAGACTPHQEIGNGAEYCSENGEPSPRNHKRTAEDLEKQGKPVIRNRSKVREEIAI